MVRNLKTKQLAGLTKKNFWKKNQIQITALLSTKSLIYSQLSIQSHGCLTVRSKIGSLRKV